MLTKKEAEAGKGSQPGLGKLMLDVGRGLSPDQLLPPGGSPLLCHPY